MWGLTPLHHHIVRAARRIGIAGASVFQGSAGYSGQGPIHTNRILSLADHTPLLIVLIDQEERLRELVATLGSCLDTGIATIDHVEVVSAVGTDPGQRQGGKETVR